MAVLVGCVGASVSAHASPTQPKPMVTNASWYGRAFKNRPTASGVLFDPEQLVGAHPSLPLGSRVCVTDLAKGRSVVVTIVDRGPFMRGRGIDLSYAAARSLGIVRRGIARVRIDLLSNRHAPPVMIAQAAGAGARLPGALTE